LKNAAVGSRNHLNQIRNRSLNAIFGFEFSKSNPL
jgi:hypothetical protein